TCQDSYPLNSENASPPGTFRVYLSCCAKAKPPKKASNAATITIAENGVLFMAYSCATVCKSISTPENDGRTLAIVAPYIGAIHRRGWQREEVRVQEARWVSDQLPSATGIPPRPTPR